MSKSLKVLFLSGFAIIILVTVSATVSGQAGQAGGAPQGPPAGRGANPRMPEQPPLPPQTGHGQGRLILAGDLADFSRPGTEPRCYMTSRFHPGQRAGFRMTAVDGATGEPEHTAQLVVHVRYGGRTIDVPMRWRGDGPYPITDYSRRPNDMWTALWEIPADAPTGTISFTVTAKDKFGRTATYEPFPNNNTQFRIVARDTPLFSKP